MQGFIQDILLEWETLHCIYLAIPFILMCVRVCVHMYTVNVCTCVCAHVHCPHVCTCVCAHVHCPHVCVPMHTVHVCMYNRVTIFIVPYTHDHIVR